MLKQNIIVCLSLCSALLLTGCVSEQSYVGSEKPVAERTFDNIEAARTRISLGLNYLRRGDTSQAKYNLERARSFAPNSAEVYSALAYYYQSVEENDQAEEYYLLAIEKDNNYADAYNNYGAFLCQLDKYYESEQLLLKAISRPGYIRVAESYENLALCQLQQNHFAKSKTYLDSSISHNSTRISSLTMAAGLFYAMGELPKAKSQLDRIQRLGRVSAKTVLLSYLIAGKMGDKDTQRNAEQLLLTLYTDTPETRLLLQGKLEDSEFERLRERYKISLMANVVIPDQTEQAAVKPSAPVENPKLKIVKRKSADNGQTTVVAGATKEKQAEAETVVAVPEKHTVATQQQATPIPLKNATSDIADSLSAETSSVITAAADVAVNLPEEKVVQTAVANTRQNAAAEQTTLATEVHAETQLQQVAQQQTAPSNNTAVALSGQPEQDPIQHDAEQHDVVSASTVTEQTAAVSTPQPEPVNVTEAQNTEDAIIAGSSLQTTADELSTQTQTDAEPTAEVLSDQTHAGTELAANVAQVSQQQVVAAQSELQQSEVATDASATESPFYLVQESDSLYAISVKHNIRLQRLMEWNQLTPESVIRTGQKIWLGPVTAEQRVAAKPEPVNNTDQVEAATPYHEVHAGETMFAISYRYNIRLDKFMAWNSLTEKSKLKVGQQLFVVDPASIEP